jgi:hypothetical protein
VVSDAGEGKATSRHRKSPSPNTELRRARERLPSPNPRRRFLSRAELAIALNKHIAAHGGGESETMHDHRSIGRYESGRVRWPGKRLRDAFRAVLGVSEDADLGFYCWISQQEPDPASFAAPAMSDVPARVNEPAQRPTPIPTADSVSADGLAGECPESGQPVDELLQVLDYVHGRDAKAAGPQASVLSRIGIGNLRPNHCDFWAAVDTEFRPDGRLLDRSDGSTRQQELDTVAIARFTPAGGMLSSLLTHPGPAHRAGAPRRPSVTDTTLANLEGITGGYRHLDHLDGAAAVTQEMSAHLNRLLALSDAVPDNLRRRYRLAVADAAQFAAWLAIDRQDYTLAGSLCGTALQHAVGLDTDLQAYVMGILGHTHLHHRRGRDALDVLGDAVRRAGSGSRPANPAVLSWLYGAIGEAHGLNSERQEGRMALSQAETLFDSVTTAPQWLGTFNSRAHLDRLKGRCLILLGEGRLAIEVLQDALAGLPTDHVREQSGTLIDLAAAYLLPDVLDPAAAANAAIRGHDLAVLTQSARNLQRVRDELLPALKPYRTLPEITALAGALAQKAARPGHVVGAT